MLFIVVGSCHASNLLCLFEGRGRHCARACCLSERAKDLDCLHRIRVKFRFDNFLGTLQNRCVRVGERALLVAEFRSASAAEFDKKEKHVVHTYN